MDAGLPTMENAGRDGSNCGEGFGRAVPPSSSTFFSKARHYLASKVAKTFHYGYQDVAVKLLQTLIVVPLNLSGFQRENSPLLSDGADDNNNSNSNSNSNSNNNNNNNDDDDDDDDDKYLE